MQDKSLAENPSLMPNMKPTLILFDMHKQLYGKSQVYDMIWDTYMYTRTQIPIQRTVETKMELLKMLWVQNAMVESRWFGPDGLTYHMGPLA